MLCTVVLEHAVDLLHFGDAHHIGQEDGHLQHGFQHHLAPAPQRQQTVHPAHKEGGQHGEQQNRQQTAQHRRHGHQRILGFFAQMFPHPFFKGGLLLGGVVVVPHAHLCRVHHVAVAHDHAFDHGNGTAHQRDLHPYPVGGSGVELGLNSTVRLAHGAAHLFGAAHHDAFHQCLPAYAGLKAFLFRLIHWLLPISAPATLGKERSFLYYIRVRTRAKFILAHKCDKICVLGAAHALWYSGRPKVTTVPRPRVLLISSVPSSAVMMESTSARPMPLPRTELLPL